MVSDESPSRPETPGRASPSPTGRGFTPPTVEELGAILPQYEFVRLIGAGGMGAVYQARQPKLNRYVAVKILPPIPDDELGFAERFEREAQSMAQLSHPHIVSVFDFGETSDGQLYFVMEYIEGADLHQLISGGELTLDHFYGWIPQICDAIQYAHERGIVHRDIKPANILIDQEGRVKIADFGLAKLTGDHPQTALTMAEISMGTPDYAAPEQLDGNHEVDWRSDIYSLGVVMYQMLTGRLPRGAFPLPSETDAALDSRLDEVVVRAMQSDPDSRFQSAAEITDRLTEIRTHASSPKPEPTPVKKSKAPGSLFPIVTTIVAASIGAGLLLTFLRREHRKEKHRSAATAAHEPVEKEPKPGNQVTASPKKETASPRVPANEKPKLPPGPEGGPGIPPRDFSRRRSGDPSEDRPSNFSAFRDKLGRKASDLGRRNQANLSIISRSPDGLETTGPIAGLPQDMKPLARLSLGQSPPQVDNLRRFAIGIQMNGRTVAWGDNSEGQLDFPPGAAIATEVAAGAFHALALRPDGTVIAWGANDAGQCDVPPDLAKVTAIGAGRDYSVALREDGTVIAWGGSGATDLPENLDSVTRISAGYAHVAALREDGTVATWGTNDFDQLEMPQNVSGVNDIACSFGNTYALREDGSLLSWGASKIEAKLPEDGIVSIHGTADSLVARDREGRLIVIGNNGRLAPVPGFLRQLPTEVSLEFAGPLIFAWRPANLRPDVESSETTTENAPEAPVIPEASHTEAGVAIAELMEILEESYREKVSGPWEDSIGQLNQFYLNHLEERQAEASAKRDLDTAVAWRDEAERVRAGEPIPESDDPSLPEPLRELRQTYREKSAEYESKRLEDEATLQTQYENALQNLQDRFTSEQKLDEALEVKAFRERADSR
ncbi:MAG: protein kinase [Verrucomicrobiae bacterium]|nr:protein kinase [Verrucomicrobiae bacterium]